MFKPHKIWDLLRYWQMDRLLPGVIRSLVETVRTCKISGRVCNTFRARIVHSLRYWQMDQLLPGAIHCMVVTAPESMINPEVFVRFRPVRVPSPQSSQKGQL